VRVLVSSKTNATAEATNQKRSARFHPRSDEAAQRNAAMKATAYQRLTIVWRKIMMPRRPSEHLG
jgi:hypothetical protein